jgi:hypothetical protein
MLVLAVRLSVLLVAFGIAYLICLAFGIPANMQRFVVVGVWAALCFAIWLATGGPRRDRFATSRRKQKQARADYAASLEADRLSRQPPAQ